MNISRVSFVVALSLPLISYGEEAAPAAAPVVEAARPPKLVAQI
jgi:hypothetical protein